MFVELFFSGWKLKVSNFTTSAAQGEPLDQRLREAGGSHALLDDGNIVGHAPELDDLVFQVGDRKGGARIAVTRLSDRTGIEEITAREFDAQRGNGFAGARANPENLELVVLIGKAALVVRVSKKSDGSGGVQEAVEGLRRSEDVFVLILKRAVYQHDAIRCERPMGQSR